MNRVWLIGVFLALCAVLCAEAAAVEVTVKADTKLYGRNGQVLEELKAGTAFSADAVKGKWVWGAVVTKTGAARGWVPLAALELDERARRLLAGARPQQPTSPQPTGPKPEPVLLRYKLEPDQVHLYEFTLKMPMKFIVTDGQGSAEGVVAILGRATYTIRGKRRDRKGHTQVEIRFKSFRYEVTSSSRGVKEITVIDAGSNAAVRELLDTTFAGRFDERGKLYLDLDKLEELSEKVPGTDIRAILGDRPVYPAGKVQPGGSWTDQGEHYLDNPNRPEERVPMTGKVRYTYTGRRTVDGKPCVLLKIRSSYQNRVDVLDREYRESSAGSVLIDQATGIPLRTIATVRVQMVGALKGITYTGQGSGTCRIRYTGDKAK